MIFEPLQISGCFAIHPQRNEDSRGYFEKDYSEEVYKRAGLNTHWVQENTSFTQKKGSLRGLHLQVGPIGEIKRIKCLKGSISEFLLDLRRESPTFGQWASLILEQGSGVQIYLPGGIAHGFQTLEDDVLLRYSHNVEYQPLAARTINFGDPSLGIQLPLSISNISKADESAPYLEEFVKTYEM